MDDDIGREIAASFGVLIQRSTRSGLYAALVEGIADGLDENAYPVLSGLARTGPRNAADLAAVVGLDRSGVSRHASRLEAAGLVRREPDPADRRSVLLVLTDAGAAAVEQMRGRFVERVSASLAAWPPGEAEAFARGLRRFVEEGPF
ncbi:transcriptional regulator, MarR family [Catenulispora acidiphila DSM 44928]|uniref:Transcriptional regulator, MarR family n=1 Tax=Catenulispora acidiphila (strain DSM 44928 / JCM 14897 / NBRC 102108 / NRRL B-24433 / ID139908) TaxID=479433 RepID=C7QGP6_CATAD|nr:MarR family transcriptional regulator [Catenulispora acidiphila]ACU74926.1 transcriptional regulator, MarR family [Catenulispora acidiphila DSM 44928]